MNPGYNNMYNYPNANVGAGWSTNYSNVNYNQYPQQNFGPTAPPSAPFQTQSYHQGGAPPPIGFIIPDCVPPNNYSQNMNPLLSNNVPQTSNNINNPSLPKSETFQGTITSTNVTNMNNSSVNQPNITPNQTNNPKPSIVVNQTTITNKTANLQKKSVEPKSDYQKGLDKLAELMDADVDLNSLEIDKMRNKYDLNK